MDKLLDYNNFINEGLIITFPISIHDDILTNNLTFLKTKNIVFKLNINYQNETFNIELLSKIDFDDVKKINYYCNNLGYFLSKFKIIKGNISNILKYNHNTFEKDIENNTGLILYYESKFDDIIEPNNIIYHATNVKNIEKILKVGLYPKAESKLEYHYERIYFSNNLTDCIKIIPKLSIFSNSKIKDYVIFEININNFININNSIIRFYKDSKSNGIYLYHNIPKERLKLLNSIYTPYNIINFDKYKINNVKNPIYLEFYLNDIVVYQLNRKSI